MKAATKLILLAARKTLAVMCFTLCFTLAAGFLSILAIALAVAPRSYLDTVAGGLQTLLKPFLRFALGNTTSTSFDPDTSENPSDTSRDLHLISIAS